MTNDLKTKTAEAICRMRLVQSRFTDSTFEDGTPYTLEDEVYNASDLYDDHAQAALQAIHDAGYRLLPRDPTARVLADAMMNAVTYDPDAKDYAITGAVLELLPPTGHPDARLVIAELSRDYRAMIRASSPAGAS